MVATYNSWLVAVSVLIAILASYAALDLASRIAQSEGRAIYYWLLGGAFSMGIGIWSMHFVGMLAFRLPIPLAYDVPITLASVLPAIAASALALVIFRLQRLTVMALFLSALAMGLGIVAMHYTGMAAMKMQPPIRYDPIFFGLSVLIAVVASAAALWIARFFLSAGLGAREIYRKTGSAVVMGFAIAGMHYTGMAAASFAPDSICLAAPDGAAGGSLGIMVGAGTVVILTMTLILSIFDARLAQQTRGLLARLTASNEELRKTQEFLSSIVDNIPNMVFVKDAAELRFVRLNRTGEQMIGFAEQELVGRNDYDFFPKEQADFFVSKDRETLGKKNQVVIEEERVKTKNGVEKILYTKKLPVLDSEGNPQYLLGISEDITERKRIEEALRESEYRLDLALEASGLAVWDYDFVTGGVRLSRHWWRILGYTPDEMPSRIEAWENLTHPDDLAHLRSKLAMHLKGSVPVLDAEYRMRAKGGEWRWIRTVGRVVERDAAGRALRGTGTHGDITLRKQQEEQLNYLAYYDALTGAANRNLLNDRLTQAVAQAHRYDHIVAVAVLNLDHFKLINDSLGHKTGDELLKIVAARLGSCVRKTDTLARFGGDEFALILPGQTDATTVSRVVERLTNTVSADPQVVEVLQRILHAISEPMAVSDRELNLTCSIGVSLYPQDGEDAETLLRNAAAALSRAKQLGRKNFQFYTAELNARVAERLALHSSLRRAFERSEFSLYYQPKTSLQTGEISGAEALLRWKKPGSGMVSPGEFIPVLEETGLIIDVGRWVMEKAAAEYIEWLAINPRPPRIAVNVSQLQLAQKDFPAMVEKILKNNEHGSAGLDFEITESFIMQDLEANIPKLRAIREMGVAIAIDDFGTGYSSLSYLAKLPVNTLKIDRAFIIGLDVSPDALAIVTTIISLARSLGLKVVAEGVETEAQLKILRLLRCDEIQGYVISPPLPAEQFREWWERFSVKPADARGRA